MSVPAEKVASPPPTTTSTSPVSAAAPAAAAPEPAAASTSESDADFQAKKRRERLEQNRISARESRKRKKTMIEELQRTVITLSRESKELNQTNETIRRQLMEIGTKHPGSVPFHVLMAFDQQTSATQPHANAAGAGTQGVGVGMNVGVKGQGPPGGMNHGTFGPGAFVAAPGQPPMLMTTNPGAPNPGTLVQGVPLHPGAPNGQAPVMPAVPNNNTPAQAAPPVPPAVGNNAAAAQAPPTAMGPNAAYPAANIQTAESEGGDASNNPSK